MRAKFALKFGWNEWTRAAERLGASRRGHRPPPYIHEAEKFACEWRVLCSATGTP